VGQSKLLRIGLKDCGVARGLESWRLFWLLAVTISIADCLGLPAVDVGSAHGMEPIIVRSVRCALPCFLVAFTASSLAALWRARFTRWLLSNRRYFGLAFALGMGWHFTFVGYYIAMFGKPFGNALIAMDVTGLAFLLALTLTSFRWYARHLSRANWRRLHKAGVYYIWLVFFYIYSAGGRFPHDAFHVIAVGILLCAVGLRAAAWMRVEVFRRGTGQLLATARETGIRIFRARYRDGLLRDPEPPNRPPESGHWGSDKLPPAVGPAKRLGSRNG
jgi:methionine sulfoxide reductase heme-binding subunit